MFDRFDWSVMVGVLCGVVFFFFKQKTAYEMRISDWSSDVCSSDLLSQFRHFLGPFKRCAVPCRRHALSMIPFHPCRIPCHNGLQCAGRLPPETIGIEPGFRPKLKEP